jgi:hypothetical protein
MNKEIIKIICHNGHDFPLKLLLMKDDGFNIVIRIKWLAANQARMDCEKKSMELGTPKDEDSQ